MKYLGYYDEIELVAGCMMLATGLLSIFSTITTLWLIRDMKKWNGYLQIIYTLASFQLLFDLQFLLVPFYRNIVCNRLTSFLNVFAGFAVALWTNVISFLLYMIVKNLQSVNINEYYWLFFGVITVFSFGYAVLENVYHYNRSTDIVDRVYDIARAVSVFFNFAIHGLISWKLSDMGYGRSDNRIEKSVHDPVRVLSARIKYYPIVQVITLSGAFWYLFGYSFKTDSYGDHMDTTQKVSLCFYALSLPAAGFGYFVIFLIFQPQAYVHFRKRSRQLYHKYCCCGGGGSETRREDRFDSSTPTELNSSGVLTHYAAEKTESLLAETDELDEDQLVQAIMRRYAPEEAHDPQSSGSTTWDLNTGL